MWSFRISTQLRAVFMWMSRIAREDDDICVCVDGRRSYYRFVMPMKIGVLPHRVHGARERETFMIFVGAVKLAPDPDQWLTVFSSAALSVFERRDRVRGVLPLRYGLSEDERRELADLAWLALQRYLSAGDPMAHSLRTNERFNLKADVCVALWVKGQLRGSLVLEHTELAYGIQQAAIGASRDPRFKPISQDEIPEISIEITILSDVRVPLSHAELRSDLVYAEKGYHLQHGTAQGWLLPEFLNVRSVSSLKELLRVLAVEKAGLVSVPSDAMIEIFEMEDFVSVPGSIPVLLYGPVPVQHTPDLTGMMRMADRAAQWLVKIQEPDGFIPPILRPGIALAARMDWARLAFTGWALAEFGIETRASEYVEAGRRVLKYLVPFLSGEHVPSRDRILFLVYTGQLARVLDEHVRLGEIQSILFPRIVRDTDIITLAQLITFWRSCDPQALPPDLSSWETEAKKRFRQDRTCADLASYAELVRSFYQSDNEFALEVISWLCDLQQADGSFPQTPSKNFAYARGTGKIFEVLAVHFAGTDQPIVRAGQWLSHLQYDDETSLYHVTPAERVRLVGAFRHDLQQKDAWIDAAGHVLLACARLQKKS